MKLKKGDKVKIIKGPANKLGKIGIVTILAVNGAIIKFSNGMATAVKSEHLQIIK